MVTPFLDLANIATRFVPPLRSTLSIPVVDGDRLIGVLTAYATQPSAFSETDRYAFEQVVTSLQHHFTQSQRSLTLVPSSREQR